MAETTPNSTLMDDVVSLTKRRGFIFPSAEIYSGMSGFWDYGPLGVELRENIRRAWWQGMVHARQDVVGLDSAIVTHPRIWEASGHLAHFADEMVDCKQCKRRFKADEIGDEKCPACGAQQLTDARKFHLMMKTFVGAAEGDTNTAYLRPETCQPIFTDFDLVRGAARMKVPFGIAQVGKAFRNEINPRNFTARSREFTQMEMEFFCKPDSAPEWFEHWKAYRREWYKKIGFKDESLRFRDHASDELAHYAAAATDVEFNFPFGWMEFEGIHNRGAWDLTQHQEHSGKKLEYFDEETKERYIPYCIETSAGLDRIMLALLCDAYTVDAAPTGAEAREGGREEQEARVVLKFSPLLAPVKVAVLPLRKKVAEPALKIYEDLRKHFATEYDEPGSIGKRYRRQDEIGTPWCVTYDFESEEDHKVTVRCRDTLLQERVEISALRRYIEDQIEFHLV